MKQVASELESIRMPQGPATTHQHYEDAEYDVAALNEAWDKTLISISSSPGGLLPLITVNIPVLISNKVEALIQYIREYYRQVY